METQRHSKIHDKERYLKSQIWVQPWTDLTKAQAKSRKALPTPNYDDSRGDVNNETTNQNQHQQQSNNDIERTMKPTKTSTTTPRRQWSNQQQRRENNETNTHNKYQQQRNSNIETIMKPATTTNINKYQESWSDVDVPKTVLVGFMATWFLAASPMRRSVSVKAT